MDRTLELALSLASAGSRNEERVLGAALALQHSELIKKDLDLRRRFIEAVDVQLLQRLLRSAPALQRIALAALGTGLADADAAAELRGCAVALAAACVSGTQAEVAVPAETSFGEVTEAPWGTEELAQAAELLRRLLRFLPPEDTAEDVVEACNTFIGSLLPQAAVGGRFVDVAIAQPALELVHEVLERRPDATPASAFALVQDCSVEHALRGTPAQRLALELLARGLAGPGPSPSCLDQALSEALAAGKPLRAVALQLAATALSKHGLSFGLPEQEAMLGRLQPLLELVAGEVRLGIEGYSSSEYLCAACMLLEAAIVAFGRESEDLESGGRLQEVVECLRHVHRAMSDIYNYCADVPAEGELPPDIAVVARVVAAWQLEDPRLFEQEFQRSLPALCRLDPEEFQVLLPCLQDVHDWYLTPALGAVLQTALAAIQDCEDELFSHLHLPGDVWRQCALMLAEVALDAAAYLPEAPLPVAPETDAMMPQQLAAVAVVTPTPVAFVVPASGPQLPRPIQAADPQHPGVQRLRDWSCALWFAGQVGHCVRSGPRRWELALLCGALLVSVPEAAVLAHARAATAAEAVWTAVAECLLDSGSVAGSVVDAATWRLTLRLAGFILDRHRGLAGALMRAASMASTGQPLNSATQLKPPSGALLPMDRRNEEEEEDDEWALADLAAQRLVEAHLAAVVATQPKGLSATVSGTTPLPSTVPSADVSSTVSSLQMPALLAGGGGLSMLD